MRISLRLLGLDLIDFTIETDTEPATGPGDSTSYPVGFTITEAPREFDPPDRS